LFGITAQEFAAGKNKVAIAGVIPTGKSLQLSNGRTKKELSVREQKAYIGELGDRGSKLPTGMHKIKALEVSG